jgi:hypothetical protein
MKYQNLLTAKSIRLLWKAKEITLRTGIGKPMIKSKENMMKKRT